MSWPDPPSGRTDPAYYHDADPLEAQLRADFTRYHHLREIGPYGETIDQQREFALQADALAVRWGRHDSLDHRSLWHQLDAAVAGWESQPEATRVAFSQVSRAKAEGRSMVADSVWRTLRQAAEITGHVEYRINGSDQDGARWRPPEPGPAVEHGPASAADRALGGRGPDLRPEQVEAIIANTARLLGEPTPDPGDDSAGAGLLPAHIATAAVDYAYDDEQVVEARQITALRQLQNVAAEHTNLASGAEGWDGWTGEPDHDQAHLAKLDALSEAMRAARRAAALAGVPATDVDTVYRAGLEGTYWYQQPGDPVRGRIARLTEERDRAHAELADLRTAGGGSVASAAVTDPAPGLGTVGAEAGSGPGGEVSAAVEAALPPTSGAPQWPAPEPVDSSYLDSARRGADIGIAP
ncbi:hypothetical protein [Nocardia sp. NPDC057227]|uniref:hypothetical protein n=1 Tax=Nocardia sp. NPDC057227 TaxID=3346056 RepID=UPI003631813E